MPVLLTAGWLTEEMVELPGRHLVISAAGFGDSILQPVAPRSIRCAIHGRSACLSCQFHGPKPRELN